MIRRLYLKLLWFKKSYPFNWAHKPLCGKYRAEVIKLGNVYVCRSCTCAYLGVLVGLIFPFTLSAFFNNHSSIMLIGLLSVVLPLSHPFIYKKLHRSFRDLLRFSLGLLIAVGGHVLFTGGLLLGVGVFLSCYIFWKIYYKKREKRKIEECLSCDEYSEETICSGYTLQSQRIREYEEEATEYLLHTGYRPKGLK